MRVFVTALIAAFALASSAYAGNIALDAAAGGIATAYCGGTGTQPCNLPGYGPLNAIDGTNSTVWVAPGSNTNGVAPYVPWLMINLNALDTVDYVAVSGWGNIWPGGMVQEITYDLYVGTDSSPADYSSGTYAPGTTGTEIAANITAHAVEPVGSFPSGSPWTSPQFAVSTSSPIQYVFYQVVASQADQYGHTIAGGYDDAYASTIFVDDPLVPEPGTFGLLGAGLLALGFTWRSRRK
jgi:hypothetical protein